MSLVSTSFTFKVKAENKLPRNVFFLKLLSDIQTSEQNENIKIKTIIED